MSMRARLHFIAAIITIARVATTSMILDHNKMTPQAPGEYRPEEEPVSRTYQYRKVMKPMLERKRRARINRCLDELKELMVGALQAEGENVSKLEKADILELTVRHLHGLKRAGRLNATEPEGAYAERFRAGFAHCATEVSQFITDATMTATALQKQGPVDPQAGARLLQHLSQCIRRLETPQQQPSVPQMAPRVQQAPPIAPRPQHPMAQHAPQYQQPPIRRPQPLKPEVLKRPLPQRLEMFDAKRMCYAPPSPPESPARLTDPALRAPWRPW